MMLIARLSAIFRRRGDEFGGVLGRAVDGALRGQLLGFAGTEAAG